MKSLLRIAASFAALVLFGSVALGAAPGTALGVNQQAEAIRDGVNVTLTVGADIFIGDLIVTGPRGQVQIKFSDSTELVVGPDSRLLIEDYLIRGNGSAGKFAVDMLAGSFRFASGTSPKSQYALSTPTGTIGIRGTGFDVFVDALTGIAYVLMYNGETKICEKAGDCEILGELCEVGEIGDSEASIIGNTTQIFGDEREELKQKFIYSVDQYKLLREFKLLHAPECLNRNFLIYPEPSKPQEQAQEPDCEDECEGECCSE